MIPWQSFLRLLSADSGTPYSVKAFIDIKINSICCCPSFRGTHVPPKVAQRSTSRKEEGSWVKNRFWKKFIKQWINSSLRSVVDFALCRTILCWRWHTIMWRVMFHVSDRLVHAIQWRQSNRQAAVSKSRSPSSLQVTHTHSVQLLKL